ncbi:Cupin domain protein [Bosea sp. OK403]|uniref:(R)-mandelonitrile lyase n=1 Tax=Bosea sp. OK403 TaxID=1855286 RepID=UPI0008EA41F6|nr:cupin domain-containing protein [Bosea sp. OK403]SFJ70969.1 Cupin domain protein [Bosea sp. OK403]
MSAKILAVVAGLMPAADALSQTAQAVTVQRAGAQAPSVGPAQNFTGTVRVDGRFQGTAPARISGGTVSFEPGARTAWHTHPLGQTLFVTTGVGLVQHWDGPVQEIRTGDTVWIPPGVKHWHGASATNGMTHVAISEALDGKTVEWLEAVSDEHYRR